MCGAGLRRCSGVRTQTPAMGHRLLRAGRLPVPPSIVVVHRRMTVRVDSAGILHVLGGQPFTWGPSSEWRRPDSNRRSLGYEPSGLPSFPTPQRYAEVSNPAHPALETRLRPARVTDSPCLLVKGADCAGVTRARGACGGPGLCVFCFSVLMGRSNTLTSPSGLARSFAGCRVASVGTVCPTYLPRALCSPIPVAGRRPEAVLSAACERPHHARQWGGSLLAAIGGERPAIFWG